LRVIHESLDYIGADRLTPHLVWMASRLATHRDLEAVPSLLVLLGQVSISTVERSLQRTTRDQPCLPRRGGHQPTGAQLRAVPMMHIPCPS
jgi:hypothetical protein